MHFSFCFPGVTFVFLFVHILLSFPMTAQSHETHSVDQTERLSASDGNVSIPQKAKQDEKVMFALNTTLSERYAQMALDTSRRGYVWAMKAMNDANNAIDAALRSRIAFEHVAVTSNEAEHALHDALIAEKSRDLIKAKLLAFNAKKAAEKTKMTFDEAMRDVDSAIDALHRVLNANNEVQMAHNKTMDFVTKALEAEKIESNNTGGNNVLPERKSERELLNDAEKKTEENSIKVFEVSLVNQLKRESKKQSDLLHKFSSEPIVRTKKDKNAMNETSNKMQSKSNLENESKLHTTSTQPSPKQELIPIHREKMDREEISVMQKKACQKKIAEATENSIFNTKKHVLSPLDNAKKMPSSIYENVKCDVSKNYPRPVQKAGIEEVVPEFQLGTGEGAIDSNDESENLNALNKANALSKVQQHEVVSHGGSSIGMKLKSDTNIHNATKVPINEKGMPFTSVDNKKYESGNNKKEDRNYNRLGKEYEAGVNGLKYGQTSKRPIKHIVSSYKKKDYLDDASMIEVSQPTEANSIGVAMKKARFISQCYARMCATHLGIAADAVAGAKAASFTASHSERRASVASAAAFDVVKRLEKKNLFANGCAIDLLVLYKFLLCIFCVVSLNN